MGKPKHFFSDNEFNTRAINKYLEDNKIHPVFSEVGEINKNAIVERFNRTLAGLLQKWRVGTNRSDWYKVLDDIVYNYNDTIHRTVKNKPRDIFKGRAKNEQTNIIINSPTFEIGDIVRIKEIKKVLGKGDYLKFSEDTYLITGKRGKRYKLQNTRTKEDTSRTYKDYEIRKASEIQYIEESNEQVPSVKRQEESNIKIKRLAREQKKLADFLSAPSRS